MQDGIVDKSHIPIWFRGDVAGGNCASVETRYIDAPVWGTKKRNHHRRRDERKNDDCPHDHNDP